MSEHFDVFISYSKKNFDVVSRIVKQMEFFGAKCWFQVNDSKQEFSSAIIDGIFNSSAFVLFLSPASINSIYVQNEIKLATERFSEEPNFKILPIFVEPIDTKELNYKKICLFIGTFNMLDIKDFNSDNDLVLRIFEQVDIHLTTNEVGVLSIYSGSSDVEKQRIRSQNKLYNKYANKHLDDLFSMFNRSPNVLDVGCSDGENILLRLNNRDYNNLVCIDVNKEKIAEAKKFNDEKHHFMLMDVTDDNFTSEMQKFLNDNKIDGIDLIHISAVLLHLKDPQKVLDKLHNLLNDDGYIFIQDEDDGVNMAHPNSLFFDNCFHIWEHSIESGDRKMGRKLPNLLHTANFKDIQLKSTTISSMDCEGDEKEALWDLYFNPNLWDANDPSFFDDAKSGDFLPVYKQEHDGYKKKYMEDKIFIMLGVFFFIAKK